MPAPLVGLAVAAAAKMAVKKLAQKAVKKKVLSNTFGSKKTIKKIAMTPKQVALKKKAAVKATDKASVKVVKPSTLSGVKNKNANISVQLRKSGEAAKRTAADVRTGMPNTTVKIKSGGNIKPATAKKTIASHPANVGRAPSPDRVKWDLETAKLTARKGKTVKINSK